MLSIISVCTSDYFQGSSRPTLAIPVHRTMTVNEFITSVREEYNSDDSFPEIVLLDEELQTFQNALTEDPFSDLDLSTTEETSETVYAYVVNY